MDWQGIARLLAEYCERPVVLFDATLRARYVSRRLERLLGEKASIGADWYGLFGVEAGHETAGACFERALGGEVGRAEVVALRDDGQRVGLLLYFEPAGEAGGGVLVSVLAASPTVSPGSPVLKGPIEYEVSLEPAEFGQLRSLKGPNLPASATEALGQACFKVLFGREGPCDGCPALVLGSSGSAASSVLSPGPEGPFFVLTAERLSADRARMGVVTVSQSTLSALVQAKIARLARRAQLSPRERDVLELLVLGRSFKEIGDILGIRERTVKFHQSNLLEKLGADGRSDLVRLIL